MASRILSAQAPSPVPLVLRLQPTHLTILDIGEEVAYRQPVIKDSAGAALAPKPALYVSAL